MRLCLFLKTTLFMIFFVYLFTFFVCAFDTHNTADELESNAYSLSADIENYADQNTVSKANEIMTALSPKSIANAVLQSLRDNISIFRRYFLYIFAVILISGIFSVISNSFYSSDLFDFISVLFMIILTLGPIGNCIEYVIESTGRLCTFMTSFIPSMTVIYTAGGSTSAAASSAIICSGATAILQILGTNLIIPGVKVCVCLCAVSGLCKNINLSGVSSFIKSTCMWLSGLVMTLFCGILSLQTSLQTGADTLALKGVKFTASRLIPVAGGMVSESLKTVLSGVAFVRKISGACGIAFILYCVIPPVASVLVFKLICSVCSLMCGIFGVNSLGGYLNGLNSSLTLLLSIVLCCTVSFIIMLAIFMKTAVNL